MRAQGSDNPRGRSLPRSHPHVGKHTAEDQRIGLYGISEREKLSDDIRPICEFEVSVRKSEILVPRLLCGYSGAEQESDRGVHPESAERGQRVRATDNERGSRPVYG